MPLAKAQFGISLVVVNNARRDEKSSKKKARRYASTLICLAAEVPCLLR
jgi:hypothetical protein